MYCAFKQCAGRAVACLANSVVRGTAKAIEGLGDEQWEITELVGTSAMKWVKELCKWSCMKPTAISPMAVRSRGHACKRVRAGACANDGCQRLAGNPIHRRTRLFQTGALQ